MSQNKIIIYQILTRLFGNHNTTRKKNGLISENGVGKMNDITDTVLCKIKSMGVSHVWYTGIIRHATTTDYQAYGIPSQHHAIVKGKAGSPYAVTDYYDVHPDLAVDVNQRMQEWLQLIKRTHHCGLKVIMDFIPNHVARQYCSVVKPKQVEDLGMSDKVTLAFSPQNNFYYCPDQSFQPQFDLLSDENKAYDEHPAKASGNDRFDNHPDINDWYETVKLNYGVDYTWDGQRVEHFSPIPDTWKKMTDILLYWASMGIDGFRCDMVEMVPQAFWAYAIPIIKQKHPQLIFIAEIYGPDKYRPYLSAGFDYLYDKVGMYDCLRDVICGRRSASEITHQWQNNDDIVEHMLYFLENHDEQRIASDFFCSDPFKAMPAIAVSLLLQSNPFMLYAGQEFGEPGMDHEGFSGIDGRTTIFDYWFLESVNNGFYNRKKLSDGAKKLENEYQKILLLANEQKAISQGQFFDLMYVNPHSDHFNPDRQYTFIRKYKEDVLLIIANFDVHPASLRIHIPEHAFDYLQMSEKRVDAVDLLTGQHQNWEWKKKTVVSTDINGYQTRVYKFK